MSERALKENYKVLILTNAMQPMQRSGVKKGLIRSIKCMETILNSEFLWTTIQWKNMMKFGAEEAFPRQ